MSLRELKKEIAALPNIQENINNFKKHWLKPIKTNTNSHMPYLQTLTAEQKSELNKLIFKSKGLLGKIEEAQLMQDKLRSYVRYLIELKLTTLNEDHGKAKYITKHLLNDEFLSLKNTIKDVQSFSENVKELKAHHLEVSDYVQKQITLEHALMFMEMPHYKYIINLLETSKEHTRIVRDLGRHFVFLAKKTNK
jgi:hypothetical protein